MFVSAINLPLQQHLRYSCTKMCFDPHTGRVVMQHLFGCHIAQSLRFDARWGESLYRVRCFAICRLVTRHVKEPLQIIGSGPTACCLQRSFDVSCHKPAFFKPSNNSMKRSSWLPVKPQSQRCITTKHVEHHSPPCA